MTQDSWAYNYGYYKTYGPSGWVQHGSQGVVGLVETGNKFVIKRDNGILICEIYEGESLCYSYNYGTFSDTINAIGFTFQHHTRYYSGSSTFTYYNLYTSFEI